MVIIITMFSFKLCCSWQSHFHNNDQESGTIIIIMSIIIMLCYISFSQCPHIIGRLLRSNSWMTGSKAVLLSGASYNASDSVVRIYMETSNTSSHRGNKSDYNKVCWLYH